MTRDRNGRFLTGNIGGPGRPPGSRNRLAEDLLTTLCADWKKHGSSVIAKVRNKNPTAYLRIIASLVPRDEPSPSPIRSELANLTDAELLAVFEEEMAELKARVERRG